MSFSSKSNDPSLFSAPRTSSLSSMMDVMYRGSSLTYKVIGGVFDFYFLAGPTPLDVVDQYTKLVGRPAPMPYWALGFHQCRWGYHNVSVVESVVDNYNRAGIPLDVIWTDDDHMYASKDFTLDPINFPQSKFVKLVNKVHSQKMKYVVLIDPPLALYLVSLHKWASEGTLQDAGGEVHITDFRRYWVSIPTRIFKFVGQRALQPLTHTYCTIKFRWRRALMLIVAISLYTQKLEKENMVQECDMIRN